MDFNTFFTFITDSSKKLSHKAITIIVSLMILITIDNIFGFSFYYNNSQKVALVNDINSIIGDSTMLTDEKAKLSDLRRNIINHRTIKDFLWSNISIPSWNAFSYVIDQNGERKKYFNPFFQFISAGILLIALMIGVTIAGINEYIGSLKRKSIFDDSLAEVLIKLAGFNFIFYFTAKAFTVLLSLIPVIYGNPVYNYFLNLGINLVLLLTMVFLFRDKDPEKTP